ncbi:hypothetical protein SAMN02910409_0302 [Prevotellaceae bacterium HUN156]|nr:hypothetical protein SAMN02910409_0302 [Prevotellaceae bacterium HUN156]
MYLCTMIINDQTWKFIRQHANDDVRKLALQGCKDAEVDLPMALQQIAGRQTAKKKLPTWAEADGVIYPPHLNMEQCSSEQTARYKASLITSKGDTYVDLTGGFGVDFYWMSQGFKHRYYIEQNAELCAIAEHNFQVLGLACSVCCCDTATFLADMPHADIVFLDPARRNEHGGRTYDIRDCTPNVLELLPLLLEKANKIILKLSPMFDWRKAVNDLKYVSEVHIVSVANECKELLLVLQQQVTDSPTITCVNDDSVFKVVSSKETDGFPAGNQWFLSRKPMVSPQETNVTEYLYEPNASIMKAGCFAEIEQQYPARQLSTNSHLFQSSVEIEDFPGRRFQIQSVSSMNKQELKSSLSEIKQANIAVRNFPLSVEQLRKKLRLKDGGDIYIFATTVGNNQHMLYICRKIG